MEMSGINAAGGSAERTLEFAAKKSASADTASLSDRRAADIAKVDIAKLESEITAADSKLTSDFLQKTIDRANNMLYAAGREFNYSVHEKTGQFMVKIVDRETKEVIREIPSEKTLDAVAKMWDLMGIFVDEKT